MIKIIAFIIVIIVNFCMLCKKQIISMRNNYGKDMHKRNYVVMITTAIKCERLVFFIII